MHRDLQAALDALREGAYAVDRARRITYWNRAAERITGFRADEVVGRSCADNILIHIDRHGTNLCRSGCPLTRILCGGRVDGEEVFLHHKAGHRLPVAMRATPLTAPDGSINGAVELFAPPESCAQTEARLAQLEQLALLDELTRLPNRRHLRQELGARVAQFRLGGPPFGILLADVDRFKLVNDAYGHAAGDCILQTVAAALQSGARTFDTIGRWGGEEFLGVFPNTSRDALWDIASRLGLLVRTSIPPGDPAPPAVTASFGGALIGDGDTAESLIARADRGLYLSKSQGRDRTTLEPTPALHSLPTGGSSVESVHPIHPV